MNIILYCSQIANCYYQSSQSIWISDCSIRVYKPFCTNCTHNSKRFKHLCSTTMLVQQYFNRVPKPESGLLNNWTKPRALEIQEHTAKKIGNRQINKNYYLQFQLLQNCFIFTLITRRISLETLSQQLICWKRTQLIKDIVYKVSGGT